MLAELRSRFNEQWSEATYQLFLRDLRQRAGIDIGFRLLETPVFLPPALLDKMVRYGLELYDQIGGNLEYRAASDAAIPRNFYVPGEPEHPFFIQADFGFVEEQGALEPKLVEIQGFPSIYALQAEMADQYRESFALEQRLGVKLDYWLGGLTKQTFRELMARAILQTHRPEEVVLLEIDPMAQKTAADFLATQRLLGIQIADVTQLEKRGRQLFFRGVHVRRIYNRVIVDELMRKNIRPAFDFTEQLDVEWAGHPNWFFRLSKFSLPWFKHPCVPPTWFLHDLRELPRDLHGYVLKPLYSFAGTGVVIGPTRDEIEAIPARSRHDYILQKRLEFVPTVNTPAGPTKVEVRIMYIRDGARYTPVNTVVRTGRGKMMGVDFNKNLDWVGASAGFFPVV